MGLCFFKEMNFQSQFSLCFMYRPPNPKIYFHFFTHFSFLLIIWACCHFLAANTVLSQSLQKKKNPKNPPGMQNMNCNDLSFSIHGSNKQLIYSGAGTCCGLIKTNVLLADHLLRGNKLTKDKLSCHAINWGKKNKNMPSWNRKWIRTFINISAGAEWRSFNFPGEKEKKEVGLK